MPKERDQHRQQTQARQEEAWKLRVQGWTQDRIAEHMGISQPAISKLLAKIEKRLYGEFVVQAEEIKARQTAQLEAVYDEAIVQWARSCEDAEKTSTVTGRAAVSPLGLQHLPDLVTTAMEGQSGNPALLAQAMAALAAIRKIWGLESPEKQEISGPAGGPVRISEVVVELPKGGE